MDPHEVPTGEWIVQARDPQGATFALASPRRFRRAAMSKIAPCLWFNGEAEEAAKIYTSIFPESEITAISRYGEGAHFPEGTALMVEFRLAGQRFQALNGGPNFFHSEAMSLSINAKDAAEVDRLWNALTVNGGAESQCGWLKDRASDDEDEEARPRGDARGSRGNVTMNKAQFELSVERYIEAPPETVFTVWTDRLEQWWCPRPWTTELIELDLRPGGRFAGVMRGPAGEEEPMEGVILEVTPNERIVFTNAFTVGWIPQKPFMVGLFEAHAGKRRNSLPRRFSSLG